jgi:AcrR family transcriptional regulator
MSNPVPPSDDGVAARIAQRTLAARGAGYSEEVRRLLDAGREVMRRCGTDSRPRVADIVAEAGLSNDAFYRHFPSKDALVEAIFEDGSERLRSYLAHQMAKARTPEGRVRRWIDGVLSQAADPEVAATTLAVLWNAGGTVTAGVGRPSVNALLADLLVEPFAELGSEDPALDATLTTNALVGRLTEHLWARSRPTRSEVDHLVRWSVAAVHGPEPRAGDG